VPDGAWRQRRRACRAVRARVARAQAGARLQTGGAAEDAGGARRWGRAARGTV